MADWSLDVTALADALRLDRFIVAHSSGGPYAVACAALLSERVSAGVILSGVTDMQWPGAWEGYIETEKQLMRIDDEEKVVAWCIERLGEEGSGFFAAIDFKLRSPTKPSSPISRSQPHSGPACAEAFRQGVIGYAHDIVVQDQPWPFDSSGIRVPIHVVHRDLDLVLPVAHSRHTAELIPGSTLTVLPGHGLFTILSELPRLAATSARSLA